MHDIVSLSGSRRRRSLPLGRLHHQVVIRLSGLLGRRAELGLAPPGLALRRAALDLGVNLDRALPQCGSELSLGIGERQETEVSYALQLGPQS